jgi:aminoglycoside phosphotransferase (APT) family kinase protein
VALDLTERNQIDYAFRPRAMGGLLRDRLVDLRQDSPGRHRACHILDAKYEPGKGCTILYRLGEDLVLGRLAWPPPDRAGSSSRLIEPLMMDAYLFPDDPLLPGLAGALNGDAMRHILGEVLPACCGGEARVLRCRSSLLRYRPARRATLRVEVVVRAEATGAITSFLLFAKLYHDQAKAAALFDDDLRLSHTRSLREDGVVVATPAGFVPALAMVLHERVAGIPLSSFFVRDPRRPGNGGSKAIAGVKSAAVAVASLHDASLQSERRRPDPGEAAERMARRSAQVSLVAPPLGDRMEALAVALLELVDPLREWGAETTFAHGDCKPSQFLIDGQSVGVLDFDHGGMADPASDVGTFTASLRQLEARQRLVSANPLPSPDPYWVELEGAFVKEYRARRAPEDDFFRRTAWYQAAALFRKAFRAFQRSPRSQLPGLLAEEGLLALRSLASRSPSPVDRLERAGVAS